MTLVGELDPRDSVEAVHFPYVPSGDKDLSLSGQDHDPHLLIGLDGSLRVE